MIKRQKLNVTLGGLNTFQGLFEDSETLQLNATKTNTKFLCKQEMHFYSQRVRFGAVTTLERDHYPLPQHYQTIVDLHQKLIKNQQESPYTTFRLSDVANLITVKQIHTLAPHHIKIFQGNNVVRVVLNGTADIKSTLHQKVYAEYEQFISKNNLQEYHSLYGQVVKLYHHDFNMDKVELIKPSQALKINIKQNTKQIHQTMKEAFKLFKDKCVNFMLEENLNQQLNLRVVDYNQKDLEIVLKLLNNLFRRDRVNLLIHSIQFNTMISLQEAEEQLLYLLE